MDAQATEGFLRFFLDLPDPRRHNVRHLFTDILTIAILAILCKSDDWTEVIEWARAQRNWLETFLLLPNGIPSEDTFRRVFARIDPAAFERCFINWTKALAASVEGKLIAVDGKTLRRSFDHAWNKQQALAQPVDLPGSTMEAPLGKPPRLHPMTPASDVTHPR